MLSLQKGCLVMRTGSYLAKCIKTAVPVAPSPPPSLSLRDIELTELYRTTRCAHSSDTTISLALRWTRAQRGPVSATALRLPPLRYERSRGTRVPENIARNHPLADPRQVTRHSARRGGGGRLGEEVKFSRGGEKYIKSPRKWNACREGDSESSSRGPPDTMK